ncbi:hypothetical protein NQ314_018721 [Rhamnusium bicolor]|uniref:Uncharacterized protein n=1 Tax=Rhamnusium bicolor TaxID=1586634 RepID=A0AAV8WQH9_9CUCU|nr:hypothetical protein NQ314_018721 [Rhamnusium bicolor]
MTTKKRIKTTDELLSIVGPKIQKQSTWFRQPISARTKLEITLRYLASGDSLTSLQYLYRVPKNTISIFLPKVLTAIYDVLQSFIMVRFC